MKIVGHRGARGLAPENTLAAVEQAIAHGVDAVEVDIQQTKDGVLVLNHDPTLMQLESARIVISRHSYKQLLDLQPGLATLQDAFTGTRSKVKLLVEIKPGVDPELVVNFARGHQSDEITYISRKFKTLKALRSALPQAKLGVIDRWSGIRAAWRCRRLGTRLVVMNQLWLWPEFIKAVKNSGYQLYAYTVNDPNKARKMAKSGLYGVITDFPDRFRPKST